MKPKFVFNKIETRSTITSTGRKKYIVKGYATSTDKPYIAEKRKDVNTGKVRGLKELFTRNAEESMKRQLSSKKIFVDMEHKIGTKANVNHFLNEMESKSGKDFTKEKERILEHMKGSDFPFAKVTDFRIDDNGLFIETEINPYYADLGDEEKQYFEASLNMILEGYVDRMSLNFNPTERIVEDGVTKINDVDVYGVSFTGGAANDWLPPLEVATRSIKEFSEGEKEWEKKIQMSTLML